MFLIGLLVGVLLGYGLAMLACGKFISPIEAIIPKRIRGVRG